MSNDDKVPGLNQRFPGDQRPIEKKWGGVDLPNKPGQVIGPVDVKPPPERKNG